MPADPTLRSPRRCRPLRHEQDERPWFITTRTIEERFWLHPLLTMGLKPVGRRARRACARLEARCDKRFVKLARQANARKRPMEPDLSAADVKRLARGLVGAALARAQEKYGAEIYAAVCMSNHVHLAVRTTKRNLSAFMGYFKARVADAVHQITGRRGPLWARRFDAQPILNEEALMDRVAYTLDNPGKANLVSDSRDWPGLNVAYGLDEADAFGFEYFDRTAWHRAKRPEDRERFWRTVTLRLSPFPCEWAASREQLGAALRSALDNAAHARRKGGMSPLGLERVVQTEFEARPKAPSFRRRPYAFGTARERRAFRSSMSDVSRLHAEASVRFRGGDRSAMFPSGTYPPPLPLAV